MSSKQLSPWLQPIEWSPQDCETTEWPCNQTLTEAAERLSVAPRTLRKLLELEAICDREKRKGSPVMVTADLIEILEAKLHRSIPFSKIPGILGVGRHIAEDLRDQGEIPMWVHGGSKGLKHRYMFVRSDVEQWIAMLVPPVRTLSVVPRGCTTIAKAVRKHVPITAIVAGLRSNTIRVIAVWKSAPIWWCHRLACGLKRLSSSGSEASLRIQTFGPSRPLQDLYASNDTEAER